MRAPKSRWWVLAPMAMMVAIQIASGLPHPSMGSVDQGFSKLEISAAKVLFSPGKTAVNLFHAPVFAILTWLWCWALVPWLRSRRSRLALVAVVCLGFGVANELSQLLVPTRLVALHDAVANALGVAVGLVAALFVPSD